MISRLRAAVFRLPDEEIYAVLDNGILPLTIELYGSSQLGSSSGAYCYGQRDLK